MRYYQKKTWGWLVVYLPNHGHGYDVLAHSKTEQGAVRWLSEMLATVLPPTAPVANVQIVNNEHNLPSA